MSFISDLLNRFKKDKAKKKIDEPVVSEDSKSDQLASENGSTSEQEQKPQKGLKQSLFKGKNNKTTAEDTKKGSRTKMISVLLLGVALVLVAVYLFLGDTIMNIISPPKQPPQRAIIKSTPSELPDIASDGNVIENNTNHVLDNSETSISNTQETNASETKPEMTTPNEIIQDFSDAKPIDFTPKTEIKNDEGLKIKNEESSKGENSVKTKSPLEQKPSNTPSMPPANTKTNSAKPNEKKEIVANESEMPNKKPERFETSPNEPLITKENAAYEVNNLALKANHLMRLGDNEAALQNFEYAYKYSKKPEFEYNIIMLSIKTGNISKAKNMLSLSWLPDNEARELLQMMYSNGYEKEAADCTSSLLAKDKHGNIYYFAGYLSEMKEDIPDASANYRRAMIKSNYDPYFTFAYARTQDIMGNYEEAMNYYRVVAGQNMNQQLKQISAKRVDDIFNM